MCKKCILQILILYRNPSGFIQIFVLAFANNNNQMFIFIDESGDPGNQNLQGSSKFFILSMVIFGNELDAKSCNESIEKLKKSMTWKGEFHFKRNSKEVRKIFLKVISKHNFTYYSVVINKKSPMNKADFYGHSIEILFKMAKEKLKRSTIVFDESGSNDFRKFISKVLRQRLNLSDKSLIKKIRVQRSSGSNLIQVADYISGIINRSVIKNDQTFRKILKEQEMKVKILDI